MTRTEIHKAASTIALMRQSNKPRSEQGMDRNQKERINDKWYYYQLRQIDEGAVMLPVSCYNWFSAK